MHYEHRVYAASADDLLDVLRTVADQFSSVLLIGHNPGIEELALQLARLSRERDPASEVPTAALATLDMGRLTLVRTRAGPRVPDRLHTTARPRSLTNAHRV